MKHKKKKGESMKITKKWLKAKGACQEGCQWFESQEETDLVKLIEISINSKDRNLLSWTNWIIVRCMTYEQYVSYAVFAAEQVLRIFEKKHPNDKRPRQAIEAAKKCIKDPSIDNKKAAYAAAYVTADAAYADANAAAYATYVTADATYVAAYAAYAAAYAAADDAAADAADAAYVTADAVYVAAYAVYVAAYAANAADDDAAYADADAAADAAAMKIKILKHGIKLLKGG